MHLLQFDTVYTIISMIEYINCNLVKAILQKKWKTILKTQKGTVMTVESVLDVKTTIIIVLYYFYEQYNFKKTLNHSILLLIR